MNDKKDEFKECIAREFEEIAKNFWKMTPVLSCLKGQRKLSSQE